jgi:hypothetical protein
MAVQRFAAMGVEVVQNQVRPDLELPILLASRVA